MSEGRPNLRAVEGEKGGGAPGPEAGPSAAASKPGRGRLLLALLALAALICGVGWFTQARETERVREALATTQDRLADVESRLAAREALLEGARERSTGLAEEAAGLADRLGELSRFLAGGEGAEEGAAQDPSAPAQPGDAPAADAPQPPPAPF